VPILSLRFPPKPGGRTVPHDNAIDFSPSEGLFLRGRIVVASVFGSVHSIFRKSQFPLVNAEDCPIKKPFFFCLVPVFTPSSILRDKHMPTVREFVVGKLSSAASQPGFTGSWRPNQQHLAKPRFWDFVNIV
jgi:hypothetical protein